MDMSIQAPLPSSRDEFLIREIVLTHDPDGRQVDSETLLQLVENTFSSAAQNVVDAQLDPIDISNIDLSDFEEATSLIMHKISKEMLSLCFNDQNTHFKTLVLLEILGHYRWDAKVVLALAAFAQTFGLFQLILQLQSDNALAGSLATVKRLPRTIGVLEPKFKALALLINTVMKVTKLIITFESWHMHHGLDGKYLDTVKAKIYVATYWIFRSILECSSQISDLRDPSPEQVCSDKTVISACALHSLGMKLNNLGDDLKEHVDIFHQMIDKGLNQKLRNMFKENNADNQEVLSTLFGLQLECPLKMSSSQQKYCSTLGLKNKIVILLISKPELLSIDKIFWLVQLTCNLTQHKKHEDRYAILWVPLSNSWSLPDKTNFEVLSNCLPWFSIRKPWSLSPPVANYIKQEWDFKEEDPIMVVLNENGVVTNSNAMDMVWIWGPKAFPFSASKERELWEQENWTIDLLISGINPLFTEWVKEGRNLCIYGSENLDWIKEFTATTKKIRNAGIQLEVIYIGCNSPGKNVKNIIDTIDQENVCTSLIFSKVHFFWFRLECIKRSVSHQGATGSDKIGNEVAELLDFSNNNKSWALFGRGSSSDTIKLEEEELEKCLDLFPLWFKHVEARGLVSAVRSVFEPSVAGRACDHTEFVQYEEELIGKTMSCSLCKRPMEKFVLYKCDGLTEKLNDSIRS